MAQIMADFCHLFILFVDSVLTATLRPTWKFFLRHLTGRSELERIIHNSSSSSFEKNQKIKNSLLKSRSLNKILNCPLEKIDSAVQSVISAKCYSSTKSLIPNYDKKNLIGADQICIFCEKLNASLIQIIGYESLQISAVNLAKELYNSRNDLHESKLLSLWTALIPDIQLSHRITDQWSHEIGFQGNDPATDFRGMGRLGLDQLIFLAQKRTVVTRRMLQISKHPVQGYPFAIVGIHMTELVLGLLTHNFLQCYFTLLHEKDGLAPQLNDLHEVYCKIFTSFDKFWYKSRPTSIMDFGMVKDKFRTHLVAQLGTENGTATFAFVE